MPGCEECEPFGGNGWVQLAFSQVKCDCLRKEEEALLNKVEYPPGMTLGEVYEWVHEQTRKTSDIGCLGDGGEAPKDEDTGVEGPITVRVRKEHAKPFCGWLSPCATKAIETVESLDVWGELFADTSESHTEAHTTEFKDKPEKIVSSHYGKVEVYADGQRIVCMGCGQDRLSTSHSGVLRCLNGCPTGFGVEK